MSRQARVRFTVCFSSVNRIAKGATAVLGWGYDVKDASATTTAGFLYKKMANGKTVTEAIAFATARFMLKVQ